MQKHDYDAIINRRNTHCAKWDEMDRKYQDKIFLKDPEETTHNLIHMGVADMDFKAPEPILAKIDAMNTHGVLGYTVLDDTFYDSIIHWMKKQYNYATNRESIVFCPRITIAISLVIQSFTEEQDSVLIHTPAYSPLKNAITLNNRRAIESELTLKDGKFTMDFDSLQASVDDSTKIFILCSPHNPTGRVWTKSELMQLSEFCIKNDLLLFTDEIHSDLIAEGYEHTCILTLSEELSKRTIYTSSITKSFNVPGLIVSHMIIPNPSIRKKVKDAIAALGINNPNIFSLGVMEAAYYECDAWLEDVKHYIDSNYTYFKSYLESYMPAFHVYPREGTYLAWVDYKQLAITEEELESWFLEDLHVSIYPGSSFGQAGIGFYRVNLATSRQQLEEVLTRMRENYHKLIKK